MTLEIDPARTALILLDYQNYNVHPDGYWAQTIPGSAERAAPAVTRTAGALAAARSAGMAVVHVQNAWRDAYPDVNPYTPWQPTRRPPVARLRAHGGSSSSTRSRRSVAS